jgi:hypothetical protein
VADFGGHMLFEESEEGPASEAVPAAHDAGYL